MKVKLLTERPMGMRVRGWLEDQGEEIVDSGHDLLIVCYYGRILKPEEFKKPKLGTINFHPGLLPVNRGMYPHIWPLVDGSKAGVTIHYIDEGIDTGDILTQKEVPVYPTDTASDLEYRTQEAIFNVFTRMWPKFKEGKIKPYKQSGTPSHHYAKEIKTIQEFDPKIIRRLRACTFQDRSYGYFVEDGKKYYVGVKFYNEKDIERFNKSQKSYANICS